MTSTDSVTLAVKVADAIGLAIAFLDIGAEYGFFAEYHCFESAELIQNCQRQTYCAMSIPLSCH